MFSFQNYSINVSFSDVLMPEWITVACGVAGLAATYAVKRFYFSSNAPPAESVPGHVPCETENPTNELIILHQAIDIPMDIPAEVITEIADSPTVPISEQEELSAGTTEAPVEKTCVDAPRLQSNVSLPVKETPTVTVELEEIFHCRESVEDDIESTLDALITEANRVRAPVDPRKNMATPTKDQIRATRKVTAWLNDNMPPSNKVKVKKTDPVLKLTPKPPTKPPTRGNINIQKDPTNDLLEGREETIVYSVAVSRESRGRSTPVTSRPVVSSGGQDESRRRRLASAAETPIETGNKASPPEPSMTHNRPDKVKVDARRKAPDPEPSRKHCRVLPDRPVRSCVVEDDSASVRSLGKSANPSQSKRSEKNIPKKPRVMIRKPKQYSSTAGRWLQSSVVTASTNIFEDHLLHSVDPKSEVAIEPEPEVVVEPEQEVVVEPGPEVVVKRKPEVVAKPKPEVVVKPEQEVVVEPGPEVVVKRKPEVIVKRTPEVVAQPKPEVVVKRKPEVVVKRKPEVVAKPRPEVVVKPEQDVVVKLEPEVAVEQVTPTLEDEQFVESVPVVADDTLFTAEDTFDNDHPSNFLFRPDFRTADDEDVSRRECCAGCPSFAQMEFHDAVPKPMVRVFLVNSNPGDADDDDDDGYDDIDSYDKESREVPTIDTHDVPVEEYSDAEVVKIHTEGYKRLQKDEKHQERKRLKRF